MEEIAAQSGRGDAAHTPRLRRILVVIGLVVAVLILVGVAIYAGAFLFLAPMM